jgi:hypothetical protein
MKSLLDLVYVLSFLAYGTPKLTLTQSSNFTYPGDVDNATVSGAQFGQTSPPFYPSPWMSPNVVGWEEAYAKAKDFVSQLTLLEKVNITTGVGWEGEQCVGQAGSVPRLGLRSMCMQDSPVGVRDTDYNSVFSSGQTVAASFDRGLMYARGYAMGTLSISFSTGGCCQSMLRGCLRCSWTFRQSLCDQEKF